MASLFIMGTHIHYLLWYLRTCKICCRKIPLLGMSALCPWWWIPIRAAPLLRPNCHVQRTPFLLFLPPSPCPLPANTTFIYTHLTLIIQFFFCQAHYCSQNVCWIVLGQYWDGGLQDKQFRKIMLIDYIKEKN